MTKKKVPPFIHIQLGNTEDDKIWGRLVVSHNSETEEQKKSAGLILKSLLGEPMRSLKKSGYDLSTLSFYVSTESRDKNPYVECKKCGILRDPDEKCSYCKTKGIE